MGNCNPKALFLISTVTAFFCEFCYIPVLVHLPQHPPNENASLCWSWDTTAEAVNNNFACPFLALFLAVLVNGILLLSTALYLAFRSCSTMESLYGRVVCKFILKYGTLATNLVTLILSLLFICLLIGYTYSSSDKVFHYTGGLIEGDQDSHYRLILVVVGTLLALVGAVVSALLCLRFARPVTEEYAEGGLFRSFTEYSYDQIN